MIGEFLLTDADEAFRAGLRGFLGHELLPRTAPSKAIGMSSSRSSGCREEPVTFAHSRTSPAVSWGIQILLTRPCSDEEA